MFASKDSLISTPDSQTSHVSARATTTTYSTVMQHLRPWQTHGRKQFRRAPSKSPISAASTGDSSKLAATWKKSRQVLHFYPVRFGQRKKRM
jgi:hypothetical protein